jgi:hypothetical protein
MHGALDRFGGALRGLFVTRRVSAQDVHELVDEGDEQDHEAARIAELRDPEGNGEHALGHVVEAPGIVGEAHGVPGEEADESRTDQKARGFGEMPRPATQPLEDEADADDFARPERVCERQERHGCHAPGGDVVAGRDVEPDLAPDREAHHQDEDRNQEQARKMAGEPIEAVERGAQHTGQHLKRKRDGRAVSLSRSRDRGNAWRPRGTQSGASRSAGEHAALRAHRAPGAPTRAALTTFYGLYAYVGAPKSIFGPVQNVRKVLSR